MASARGLELVGELEELDGALEIRAILRGGSGLVGVAPLLESELRERARIDSIVLGVLERGIQIVVQIQRILNCREQEVALRVLWIRSDSLLGRFHCLLQLTGLVEPRVAPSSWRLGSFGNFLTPSAAVSDAFCACPEALYAPARRV